MRFNGVLARLFRGLPTANVNCGMCLTRLSSNVNQPAVLSDSGEVSEHAKIRLQVPKDFDISRYNTPPGPSYTLAAFADRSPVLQKLIALGVEIYKFDNKPEVRDNLLKLDFERDVQPYLQFLWQIGVPPDSLGHFITQNPEIFTCDLEDLSVRINYLESKNFTLKMIAEIITKEPRWLLFSVKSIDKRLGFLQTSLRLTGDNVRKIVVECPRIAIMSQDTLTINIHCLKEQMCLDKISLKNLVLKFPSILRRKSCDIQNSFYYLQNKMNIPISLIIQQPIVLSTRVHILKERHQFLVKLGRAQYNPEMPGYISLVALVQSSDEEFCKSIAFTPVDVYHNFLKTL